MLEGRQDLALWRPAALRSLVLRGAEQLGRLVVRADSRMHKISAESCWAMLQALEPVDLQVLMEALELVGVVLEDPADHLEHPLVLPALAAAR